MIVEPNAILLIIHVNFNIGEIRYTFPASGHSKKVTVSLFSLQTVLPANHKFPGSNSFFCLYRNQVNPISQARNIN